MNCELELETLIDNLVTLFTSQQSGLQANVEDLERCSRALYEGFRLCVGNPMSPMERRALGVLVTSPRGAGLEYWSARAEGALDMCSRFATGGLSRAGIAEQANGLADVTPIGERESAIGHGLRSNPAHDEPPTKLTEQAADPFAVPEEI